VPQLTWIEDFRCSGWSFSGHRPAPHDDRARQHVVQGLAPVRRSDHEEAEVQRQNDEPLGGVAGRGAREGEPTAVEVGDRKPSQPHADGRLPRRTVEQG
jgi:hypothetical protein